MVEKEAPTWLSKVCACYVVMMTHAIDRYFSLCSALVQVLDYVTVGLLEKFVFSLPKTWECNRCESASFIPKKCIRTNVTNLPM